MRRSLLITLVGSVVLAASAHADFVGFDIKEDKIIDPADEAAADPGGQGLRVFNFYARFDNVGETGNTGNAVNKVLSVGQFNETDTFGINMADGKNQGATFYQNAVNGDRPPSTTLIGLVPGLSVDTYVGLGNKTNLNGVNDTTSTNPLFAFLPSRVQGGWFNGGGDNGQNVATPDPDGFSVFIGQFTTLGLDAGADLGSFVGGGGGIWTYESEVFDGSFIIFTQQDGGGAIPQFVNFEKVPAPGAIAVFGIAGLAAGRRRRA